MQRAARLNDFLFELEGRNTEREESADARVAIEDHRLHAVANENVGAAKTRRPRADDRYTLCLWRARSTCPAASPASAPRP